MTYVLSLARRRIAVPCKLALAFLLTFMVDWSLFGWDPGVLVVLFFLALAACAIIANPVHASSP